MRLVPALVAEVYAPSLGEEASKLLATCGRAVGESVEVDLDLVASRVGPETADLLEAYWEACRRLWEQHEAGRKNLACVRVRRQLAHFQQKNTKTEKKDLTAQMEALDEVAGVGELVAALTEKTVDRELVENLVTGLQGSLHFDGAWTQCEFSSQADVEWPRVLGGSASLGEVRRVFTLSVNHAAWRDRRNRRLVELTVEAEELWPRP